MKVTNDDQDDNRYNRDERGRKGGEASINNAIDYDTDLDGDDAEMFDTETDIDGMNNRTADRNRSGTYSR